MTPQEFRAICEETNTGVNDLVRIMKTAPRSVSRWYSGARPVPAGVALLLRTLRHVQGFTDYGDTARFLHSELERFEDLNRRGKAPDNELQN